MFDVLRHRCRCTSEGSYLLNAYYEMDSSTVCDSKVPLSLNICCDLKRLMSDVATPLVVFIKHIYIYEIF